MQESVEFADRAGGLEQLGPFTNGVLVAGRLRDWPLALENAARSIPVLHWNSDRPQLGGVLNVTARALVDHDPDTAAILLGAVRSLTPAIASRSTSAPDATAPAATSQTSVGVVAELRRETSLLLDDTIGADRRRERRSQGEAMDQDQVVALVLDAIQRALSTGG